MDCNVFDWWVVLAFEEREWIELDEIVLKESIGWDILYELKSYLSEKLFLQLVLMCFGTNSWNMFDVPTFHLDEYLKCKVIQHLVVLNEATNASTMCCLIDASNFISFLIVIHSIDLMVITIGIATKWFLYTEYAPLTWFHFALCVLIGIIISYCFVWIS